MAINLYRSGDNEYVGSFYASRLKSDPPGLSVAFSSKKEM